MNEEIIAYYKSWQAVAEIEHQEMQAASLSERWQQLNAVVGLAIGLGIFKEDPSEREVYQRWAKLKGQANNQRLKY